jgi:hypothetical protein
MARVPPHTVARNLELDRPTLVGKARRCPHREAGAHGKFDFATSLGTESGSIAGDGDLDTAISGGREPLPYSPHPPHDETNTTGMNTARYRQTT